jgi:hypothetical protein
VHAQDVALRAVEPGEDDDLVAVANALEGVQDRRLEDEPRVWRSLVALFRGRREVSG